MDELRRGGFLIAKIHQLAGRILTKIMKDHNVDEINPAQGRILFFLWEEDRISIQELGRRTSLEKSTLTSMLDRLEHAGYLRRVHCPEDRRKILIELTAKALEIKDTYKGIVEEAAQIFYVGFSPEEIDQCEAYLERMYTNLYTFEYQGKTDTPLEGGCDR